MSHKKTGGPQNFEGGDRKGARKAVEHKNPRVENIKNARIVVGATRAPRITPQEGAAQGPLGELFDSLGDFATGPFATAMKDGYFKGKQVRAEKDVLSGKSLDEIEDKDFVYEFYHRGATGRKLGSTLTSQAQELIDKNADDLSFDHEAAVSSLLGDALEGLDDDTSNNAANVLRRTIQPLMDKEAKRRTTKARLETLRVGMEATTAETDVLFAAKDFSGAMDVYEAGFQDAKLLDGPFDAKNFNQNIVSDVIAAIQNPKNEMTQVDIDALEEELKVPRANGSALWTNPNVNARLRKAFARMRASTRQAQTLDQLLAAKRLLAAASDFDTVEDESVTRQREASQQITTSQAAGIIVKADGTRKDEAEMVGRIIAVTSPAEFRAVDSNAFDWVNDPTTLDATVERMVEEQEAIGVDSDEARTGAATLMLRDHGVTVPRLNDEALNRVRTGDYKYGLKYLRVVQAQSPITSGTVFGSADIRASLEFYSTMATATDANTAKEAVDKAYENLPAARKAMNDRDVRTEFSDLLASNDVDTDVGVRQRVLDRTIFNVATGMAPRVGALEAIRLEKEETFFDEDDTPMTVDTFIESWDQDDVREKTRADFLKPWLERRGIDTDNFFANDENRAIIRPTRNGMGLVQTPEGTILGVVPLATWSSETFKTIQSEAAKAVAEANKAADIERGREKNLPSRFQRNPAPTREPAKKRPNPGPALS